MSRRDSDSDPEWYKDAVIYELHVRSFHDSNGDGIGDFNGLVEKLDYLRDLGITAIWLLPFYPSPLRDDGYDIAHYTSVNPSYGTLSDFRNFLRESHRRGIRVITELVVNHTSNEHPWFQRARRSPPGSKERDFYVWSDTPDRYQDARIIFQDFESSNWAWDPLAKAYYWHRFYSHQPDLNFDNPRVRRALLRVLDFWMGLGVDGMRLDAVPYLFEREGTNCENLPETHAYLKELRAHIDARYANRMLLAEANQWPSDSAAYFGNGDECHMNFHFPLMPRMFMAVQLEDRFPVQDILQQTPAIPESCQWATFLRNHDKLTLEMVTDEDRDYMWRAYAEDSQARINLGIRRRLHPLLKTRRKVELMNALLFSLPGTPVLYYGDEIGMGDNMYLGDRNGVRTPFQWSSDRNAGFSRANPQKLYLPVIIDPEYHFEAVNVETHQANPTSLLWWMKRLIAARKDHPALARGSLEILHPANKKVLVFLRTNGDERILVVANLSRYTQCVELDLSQHQGSVPEEVFGRSRFPAIGEHPYFLTLAPYGFYWLLLRPAESAAGVKDPSELRRLEVGASWRELLSERRGELENLLLEHLPRQRWFRAKARKARSARIADTIEITKSASGSVLLLVRVDFFDGEEELYALPLTASFDEEAKGVLERAPGAALAHLTVTAGQPGESAPSNGVLHDAAQSPAFAEALLACIARNKGLRGEQGQISCWTRPGALDKQPDMTELAPRPGSAEQSNTSILYGKRYILKLVRRLDFGKHPDVELTGFLDRKGFEHVPRLVGTLEYKGDGPLTACVGILSSFVPSRGDGWQLTLEMLDRYFEEALAREGGGAEPPASFGTEIIDAARTGLPEPARELLGSYLPLVRLLGRRTAEMSGVMFPPTRRASQLVTRSPCTPALIFMSDAGR
jgi:maltose alpha-D-glucosyltransferase/alpha-amylase